MKATVSRAAVSFIFGLFLLQQSAPSTSAQVLIASNAPDPRVEELIRKLQQLTAPQPQQRSASPRAASRTHIIAKFNIVEKSQTACKRNAVISYQVLDANSQFLSGTSTKEMRCAQGKCTATVHAYVRILDADPNQKINVFPSATSVCSLQQSGNTYQAKNSPSQTATFPGDSLDHGGNRTTNVVGDI